MGNGYQQRRELRRFQLVRQVPADDGGGPIDVLIDFLIRNYPNGIEALAEACRPLLAHPSGEQGYRYISEKFNELDGYGPTCVRRFVEETQILGERTPDQWQADAFGQVDAWLRVPGLRT
jgi:hypothetical protein